MAHKRKVYWVCYGTIWFLLIRVMEFRFSCRGIEVSTNDNDNVVDTYIESILGEYREGLVFLNVRQMISRIHSKLKDT